MRWERGGKRGRQGRRDDVGEKVERWAVLGREGMRSPFQRIHLHGSKSQTSLQNSQTSTPMAYKKAPRHGKQLGRRAPPA